MTISYHLGTLNLRFWLVKYLVTVNRQPSTINSQPSTVNHQR
ncbi:MULTISPECIES: hypothetical protein [unclassified Tolypothrix]|nr:MULTISPECIES: hypothetical protein [unclassified Tolypothrix]